MKEADRFIVLPRGKRQSLRSKFGVSESMITAALSFQTKSELGRRIRTAAVNLYNGIPFI